MSAERDVFAEVVNLLAAPAALTIRAADQAWRGVESVIQAVDNVNRTATRVNALLDQIEPLVPLLALLPTLMAQPTQPIPKPTGKQKPK